MASNKYKALFTALLDKEDVSYADMNDNAVGIIWEGENIPSIPILIYFEEDGAPLVEIKCWDIMHCPKEKRIAFLRTCNELNLKYRLVSFCLDEDDEVVAQLDHYIEEKNFGKICFTLVIHLYSIVDNAYLSFTKALGRKKR